VFKSRTAHHLYHRLSKRFPDLTSLLSQNAGRSWRAQESDFHSFRRMVTHRNRINEPSAPSPPRGSVKSLPIRKRMPSLRLFEITMEQIDFGYGRLRQFHRRSRFQGRSGGLSISRKNFPKTDKCFAILAIALGRARPVQRGAHRCYEAITHCKHDRYSYINAPTPTIRRFGTPDARQVP
jgi:hypothetical protein